MTIHSHSNEFSGANFPQHAIQIVTNILIGYSPEREGAGRMRPAPLRFGDGVERALR